MIVIYAAFALAFFLAATLFLLARRTLTLQLRVSGIASYILAYWAGWMTGAPWWSPVCGAFVGVLIGQYLNQWLLCRQLAGEVQPLRSLLTYALMTGVFWLVVVVWHVNNVAGNAIDTFMEGEKSRAHAFAKRSDAARFVVNNYIPCIMAQTALSTGSRFASHSHLPRTSPLACHAHVVEVATGANGRSFAKEVSMSIDNWTKVRSELSQSERYAFAEFAVLGLN